MPPPIGVAELFAGVGYAAINSFGSLCLSPRTMMAQAIRAILLASATAATASLKSGGWQTGHGSNVHGKTLGVVGLGNIGREVARIGRAFGMKMIAWSQNRTEEKASAAGALLVDKQTLFREADVVTIHLILSGRTKGLIGASEFALMKPTARFVNTSRGLIVDEAALIAALQARKIAGAAVDAFDVEPLPPDHPYRKLDNILATPHIGYVTEDLYRTFYGDAAVNIANWLALNAKVAYAAVTSGALF
jgi:phosphoglycerate dehydrogenase-like enzyme